MAISAQVFVPYFACEYPPDSYTMRLTGGGSWGIPLTLPADCYFIRNGSTNSIAAEVVAALNAYATGDPSFASAFGTWSFVTTAAADSIGFVSFLRSTGGTNWMLTYSGAGDFDWSWLGLPIGITSSASGLFKRVASTIYPAGTWLPKIRCNDLGMLPSPAQVSYSPMTANGSISVVDMSGDPSTLPKWWVLHLDGTLGVHGARMQRYRTAKPAWASAIGVATDAAFVPLDYPGGWWSLAVRGTRFIIGDEAADDQFVGALRIHASSECPEGMDPIRGLRSPTITPTRAAGGRRDLKLAFLYEELV
jgi:hypothetical protein